VVVALIAANGFFVATEFALVAADRHRVEAAAESGDRRAGVVLRLLRRLSFHLSGAQLGITITSLVVGFVAPAAIGGLLEPLVGRVLDGPALSAVVVIAALVVATMAQMVLGELVPKTVAIATPDRTARRVARTARAYGIVFGPVIRLLNGAADAAVRAVGVEPKEELSSVRTLSELQVLFVTSTDEGTLGPSAGQLLDRSIRLAEKTAADALVPRLEVVSVSVEATVADLVELGTTTGHSRFPVTAGELDEVVGIVHVKSALATPRASRHEVAVTALMSDAVAVPESRPLDDLLGDLRAGRTHLVVVVDEYGGTAGIITLEDVLEEIVGEISDEYDLDTAGMSQEIAPGDHLVDGALHGDEVADLTGFDLPDGDYETIAGFVLERLGHIPDVGESLTEAGWRFEVVAMDRRRVARIRVTAPTGTGPQRGRRRGRPT
jgi:CBS domain containing-hemolysin-like protein